MGDAGNMSGSGYSYPWHDFSAGAVSTDWYKDVLFIGDSRVDGQRLYARSGNAHYFCVSSMNTFNVRSVSCYDSTIGTARLSDVLSRNSYGKIYLALGINDAGYALSTFANKYRELVNYIRSMQPNAIIILQAVLPVSLNYCRYGECFRPYNLEPMNQVIAGCANGYNTFYVNPNPYFANQDGYLYSNITSDGCHLDPAYCRAFSSWVSYAVGSNGLGLGWMIGPGATPPVDPPGDDPEEGTTEAPGEGTTEAPGEGTTEAPGEGTTEAPGEGTTEAPGEGTTEAPGEGTTEAPGEGTTDAPGEGTTEAPGEGTTEAPDQGTTEDPEGDNE